MQLLKKPIIALFLMLSLDGEFKADSSFTSCKKFLHKNIILVLNVWIIFMYLIQRQHNLPVLLPQYSVVSMSVKLSFDVAHSSVCPPGFTLQVEFTALGCVGFGRG